MKYLIMLTIVIGLALSDFLTGIIKAYKNHDLSSTKMREGGLNKIGEIIVMATVCGLEIGINLLGKYYQAEAAESDNVIVQRLAGIAGAVAAGGVFVYIVIMELISMLENYAETNKDAVWARRLIKRLRVFASKTVDDPADDLDEGELPQADDGEGE